MFDKVKDTVNKVKENEKFMTAMKKTGSVALEVVGTIVFMTVADAGSEKLKAGMKALRAKKSKTE